MILGIKHLRAAVFVLACGSIAGFGQQPAANQPSAAGVDFERDVKPIFQGHCLECHGPNQQMGAFRLDQKRHAMIGGFSGILIVPGNSRVSKLMLRLEGTSEGQQMPPTGPLSPEKIAAIRAWIDQGAPWPETAAARKASWRVPTGATKQLFEAIREGRTGEVRRLLTTRPALARATDEEGSTALMHAAVYGDPPLVSLLLAKGADPRVTNAAGATALAWALDEPEKVRRLLARGADPNARSEDGMTPVLIAASQAQSAVVLRLLLDKGGKPNATGPGGITALALACDSGDVESVRLLLARGAHPDPVAVINATFSCEPCLDVLLAAKPDPKMLGAALGFAAWRGSLTMVQRLVEAGADVNEASFRGRTPLMFAAYCELLPAEIVKLLLARGAALDARTPDGETALTIARKRGETDIVRLLAAAGAR